MVGVNQRINDLLLLSETEYKVVHQIEIVALENLKKKVQPNDLQLTRP